MSAPSGTVWGSKCSNDYGRIGIYVKLTTAATKVTREVQIWFWSKYSVQDPSNTLYYDTGESVSAATTSKGACDIETYNDSGSGWATSNQQLLKTYTADYTRGTSANTYKIYAKLTGVYNTGTMTVNTSFTIPALASYKVTYNANGGTGAPNTQTKWYGKSLTLSSTKPTRTGYSFQGWATSASGSVAYDPGDSYTSNAAVTLYAIWKANTYAVKYNANGGSGAPSSQTKTYGKTLTLSSTKPTRTGYSFQGWATSASGSVVYAAGASYTKNAAVTLYAVWKANTYTVKYDANGGTGAPSSQTKTYGKTLTLSNTKPTRTGYSFQGWATSASGSVAYAAGASYTNNAAVTLYAIWTVNTYTITYNANGGTLGSVKTQTKNYGTALKLTGTATRSNYTFKGWATSASGSVVYASGANYTANAAATLYAVWELSYVKPKISSFSVTRCNSSGTATDEGTYCRVKFNWTSSVANPTALIEWKETEAKSKTVTLSGTSGTVNQIIGGSFSTEKSYSIKITVDDGKDPQSTTKNLPGVVFPIDVKAGGRGVAIGKPAEVTDQFDCGFHARFRKNVLFGEKTGYHDGKTGVYVDGSGYVHIQRSSAEGYHPYLGFYIDDSTDADGQIRLNSNTKQMEFLSAVGYKFGNTVYLPNNIHLEGISTGGVACGLIYLNTNNNTIVGYGGYSQGLGTTNLYGNQINFGVRAGGAGSTTTAFFKPYYEKGDTISNQTINTAGYITDNKTQICFFIPLAKPVIGNPTVTISSTSGLTLRQNNSYTHNSASGSPAVPTSYTATLYANHIKVIAKYSTTTGATNNSTIGIAWTGNITFS